MPGLESHILCKPGGIINEDTALAGSNWFIVLDGSSWLSGRRVTAGPSDAAWFVENIAHCFACEIGHAPDAGLETLLRRAVRTTSERYWAQTKGHDVDRMDQPSASVIAVRWADGRLDYLLMGDGGMVVKSDGVVSVLQDRRVAAFDQIALARLRAAMPGKSLEAALAEIRPTLLKNRAMKNVSEGYWVLDLSENCLIMAQSGSLTVGGTGDVIAFTDGFAALADTFGTVTSYSALLDMVSEVGLLRAEERLLNAAKADPTCLKFPRFKYLDDYTCVLARR